jgi:hypothetical protein
MPVIASAASAASAKIASVVATAAAASTAAEPGWFHAGTISFEWAKAWPGWVIPAIFSFLAWRVTVGQHVTARAKLNLDLFERRYAAYQLLSEFMHCHLFDVERRRELYDKLQDATAEYRFLFGGAIYGYVLEAMSKSTALAVATDVLRQVYEDHPGQHDEARVEKKLIMRWFGMEISQMPTRFAPYLDFSAWAAVDDGPPWWVFWRHAAARLRRAFRPSAPTP